MYVQIVYACMYVHVHVRMCRKSKMYVSMHVYTYGIVQITYACACVCMYVQIYACVFKKPQQGTNNMSQPSHETKTKVRTTQSSDSIQSTR